MHTFYVVLWHEKWNTFVFREWNADHENLSNRDIINMQLKFQEHFDLPFVPHVISWQLLRKEPSSAV